MSSNEIKIPENCYIKYIDCKDNNGKTTTVPKAVPILSLNTIKVRKVGTMTEISMQSASMKSGTNAKEIHDFNVAMGSIPPAEMTAEKRKSESKRTSKSRTVKVIRELAACNPWDYFVTITLKPAKWDRQNPEKLQETLQLLSKEWKKTVIAGKKPSRDNKYLIVPEFHHDGKAVHLHGFWFHIPETELIAYTMDDVNSKIALPAYICDRVRAGEPLYHCKTWDEIFGYNCIEAIRHQNKAANYLSKYISKDINDKFPSRYWHSRGLARAKTVAQFQLGVTTAELEEYRERAASFAAVTKNGEILQRELFRPTDIGDELVGISTIVDGERYSTDDVVNALSDKYKKI